MSVQTDERIFYNCYKKYLEIKKVKENKVDASLDRTEINVLASRVSVLNTSLSEEGLYSILDKTKDLKGKRSIHRIRCHKKRNPKCVSSGFEKQMDQLVKTLCRWEAEMISGLRVQETGGERIDINEVFSKKTNVNRLGTMMARDIISSEIREENSASRFVTTYFITNTGKKYHREDCPFCKGRYLSEVTQAMVEYQKLEPCKCLTSIAVKNSYDPSYMTAFIDESIHPVAWNENGKKGKEGSYSYIICRRRLKSEDEICDELFVDDGVDFFGEDKQLQRVTEAAVGKVLLSLLYDHEFDGNVVIYTDNKSVSDTWEKGTYNSKLAKSFQSVVVRFIPREKNRKADKLGRTRMLLDMPIATYNEITKKCEKIKDLEKEIRAKEEEIKILREQEGVIVVKQLVDLTTPSMITNVERDTLSLEE